MYIDENMLLSSENMLLSSDGNKRNKKAEARATVEHLSDRFIAGSVVSFLPVCSIQSCPSRCRLCYSGEWIKQEETY
ncbi:MAG TPA: hypothetical protein VE971_01600 [Candidatus Eisenbacteria bacterium]|nr:hypothetical protein [Candidatus Eisenbacteria bacterium]